MKNLVWMYNWLQNKELGLATLESFTRSKFEYSDLLHFHVWGCPVLVLKSKLKNDQNIPKWNRRARVGQFMGFLDEHSSLVENV